MDLMDLAYIKYFILFLTGCLSIIYLMRYISSIKDSYVSLDDYKSLNEELVGVKKRANDLAKIKFADENIFNFIRCINIPQSPTCAPVGDGSGETVCRSRQINCNKLKLVLENDPVAVERMKVATDRFYQTGKPTNMSDLTYPVTNNWWFF